VRREKKEELVCARTTRVVVPRMAVVTPLPPPPQHPGNNEDGSMSAWQSMQIPPAVKSTPSPVRALHGEGEFLAALASADDRLVVVKWYAPYCRSCKALGVKFEKYARETVRASWAKGRVLFFEVDISENKQLYRAHQVQYLPTIRFYKRDLGMVEDFTVGPSKFQILKAKVTQWLDSSSSEDSEA